MVAPFSRFFGIPKIKLPVLGVLVLSAFQSSLAAIDRKTLGALFAEVRESVEKPPRCDVLFIYCEIDASGQIVGTNLGLRELIRISSARIVVVASPNEGKHYIAASSPKRYGRANLVMTLNRKGDAFGQFFHRLFSDMKQGTSMPVAWVKLAPQAPIVEQSSCPDTIFACELGQLAFA